MPGVGVGGVQSEVRDKGTVGFTVWLTSRPHYCTKLHTDNEELFCRSELPEQVCFPGIKKNNKKKNKYGKQNSQKKEEGEKKMYLLS